MKSETEIDSIAREVQGIIFDVDGVLTDGRIIYGDDGTEYKAFNVRDGASLKLLNSHIPVAIITGRRSNVVKRRADELGIRHLEQGAASKAAALTALIDAGFPADHLASVGDDLADLELFSDERVTLNMTVADAHPEVLLQAHYVSPYNGGGGVAIDIARIVLNAQDKWPF